MLHSGLWAWQQPVSIFRPFLWRQKNKVHAAQHWIAQEPPQNTYVQKGMSCHGKCKGETPEGRRVYNAVATVAQQCTSQRKRALAWSWEQLEPYFTHVYCNSRASCSAWRPGFRSSSLLLDFILKAELRSESTGRRGCNELHHHGNSTAPKIFTNGGTF